MKRKLMISALAGLLLAAPGMQANIFYLQGFANDTGAFQKSPDYGWEWYYNHASTGVLADAMATSSRVHYFSGSAAVANVNAEAPFGDEIAQGYWVMNTGSNQLAYVPLELPRSYADIAVSFEMNHSATSDSSWHVALRFGADNWYVSAPSGNYTGGYQQFSVAVEDSSSWLPLVFAEGSPLSVVNSPVTFDAIAGDITAAGFYGDINVSTTHRIDNFEVMATVPEPAAMGLAFGLLVLLFAVRRRSR
jgi:hypothetical protein